MTGILSDLSVVLPAPVTAQVIKTSLEGCNFVIRILRSGNGLDCYLFKFMEIQNSMLTLGLACAILFTQKILHFTT